MDYRKLKGTALEVSRLCFGTMTFGKPVDQAAADRMVARCVDEGINFVDTANVYQLGIAETMLGHAIQSRRDKLVVATKVRGKMGDGPDESGLSKRAIFRAVEDSLKRLKTDYIDLYYLHQPDNSVPVEETLRCHRGPYKTREGSIPRHIELLGMANMRNALRCGEKSIYGRPNCRSPCTTCSRGESNRNSYLWPRSSTFPSLRTIRWPAAC